jgi:cytoskeletal protein RodZ
MLHNEQQAENATVANKYAEVGAMLKNKRQDMNISIEKVAATVKIRIEYIQMIENGNYAEASQQIYYYGCVGAIARMLGLSDESILDYLLEEEFKMLNGKNIITKENETENTSEYLMSLKQKSIKKKFLILFAIFALLLAIAKITGEKQNSQERILESQISQQ